MAVLPQGRWFAGPQKTVINDDGHLGSRFFCGNFKNILGDQQEKTDPMCQPYLRWGIATEGSLWTFTDVEKMADGQILLETSQKMIQQWDAWKSGTPNTYPQWNWLHLDSLQGQGCNTYPTYGKGKSSSQLLLKGICGDMLIALLRLRLAG